MPENQTNNNSNNNNNSDNNNVDKERKEAEKAAIKQTIADLKSATIKGDEHSCYRTFLCQ